MNIDKKVILTCAVTGENQYNQTHPNFPITPQQIADAALEEVLPIGPRANDLAILRVDLVGWLRQNLAS